MNTFNLKILSAEKKLFEGEVTYVNVLCDEGSIGILANHASLVSNIRPGNIVIKDDSNQEKIIEVTSSGFIEVSKNKVTIFVFI